MNPGPAVVMQVRKADIKHTSGLGSCVKIKEKSSHKLQGNSTHHFEYHYQ